MRLLDDGSVLWTATAQGYGPPCIRDVDGDGAAEVIHADRSELFIWDGATGAELYSGA